MVLKYLSLVSLAAASNRLLKDYSTHPSAPEVRKVQLDIQNEWRENLVNGVTFPGVYGTDLNKFFWSDELERDARNYAKQCNFYHPTSQLRSLMEGENLAMFWIPNDSVEPYEEDLPRAGKHSVNKLASTEWFYFSKARGKSFSQLANPAAQAFSAQFVPEAGHYTQMMNAKTTHVGCANVLCDGLIEKNGQLMKQPGGAVDQYKAFYTVCRYKVPGNNHPFFFFDRTFDQSKIASKCKHGNENGLCLPKGYTPPATCEWHGGIEENVDYKVYNAKHDAVLDLWWGAPAPGRVVKTSGASWSYGDASEKFRFVRDEKSCNYLITVGGYAVADQGDELELVELNPVDKKQQFQIDAEGRFFDLKLRIKTLKGLAFDAKSASAVVVPEAFDANDKGQVWTLGKW